MDIRIKDHTVYAYTGGKPLNPELPTVVFVHGVLNDHSVWILQSRYLAHHGWNVLAVDLPGHGRSAGTAAVSVEEASQFLVNLLDAAGIQQVALVGHSFGSLIALHTAAWHPGRVSQLAMVGTAFPMKVSPTLLDWSLNQPEKAIDLVNTLSHSTWAPGPSVLGPGTWLYGGSKALMRRVLRDNPSVNVFHRGFKACDDYAAGTDDMAQVTCPVLFVLGQSDQMTPPQAASSLVGAAANFSVVTLPAGHALMSECPDGVLKALTDFLAKPGTSA